MQEILNNSQEFLLLQSGQLDQFKIMNSIESKRLVSLKRSLMEQGQVVWSVDFPSRKKPTLPIEMDERDTRKTIIIEKLQEINIRPIDKLVILAQSLSATLIIEIFEQINFDNISKVELFLIGYIQDTTIGKLNSVSRILCLFGENDCISYYDSKLDSYSTPVKPYQYKDTTLLNIKTNNQDLPISHIIVTGENHLLTKNNSISHAVIKSLLVRPINTSFGTNAKKFNLSSVHKNITSLRPIQKFIAKNLKNKNNLLDLGAGAGNFSMALFKDFEKITFVDPSPNMLDICRSKVKKNHRENDAKFLQESAEEISVIDKSIDCVVSRLAAHHFHNIEKVLTGIHRILSNEGMFILIDLTSPEEKSLMVKNHEIEILHDPTHICSESNIEWRKKLNAAGFKIIENLSNIKESEDGISIKEWVSLTGTENMSEIITNRLDQLTPIELNSMGYSKLNNEYKNHVQVSVFICAKATTCQ